MVTGGKVTAVEVESSEVESVEEAEGVKREALTSLEYALSAPLESMEVTT